MMVKDDRLTHLRKKTDEAIVTDNPWRRLREFTAARIGLGRAGVSTPTRESLEFQLAHAQARDAVHTELDFAGLQHDLIALAEKYPTLNSEKPLMLHSQATDRMTYLQRPDWGRQLDETSLAALEPHKAIEPYDLAIVIADGLSATAIKENAVVFIETLVQAMQGSEHSYSLAPIVLVEQGRVAVGDDVCEALNAKAVLVLIGERPGLSSPDSLGLYLTWAAKRGLTDDKRNCISNVRKAGLSYFAASQKSLYLLTEARRLQCSGVAIKDRSTDKIIDSNAVQTSFLLDK